MVFPCVDAMLQRRARSAVPMLVRECRAEEKVELLVTSSCPFFFSFVFSCPLAVLALLPRSESARLDTYLCSMLVGL